MSQNPSTSTIYDRRSADEAPARYQDAAENGSNERCQIRVDHLRFRLLRPGLEGLSYELETAHVVTAARELSLPVFEAWRATAELEVAVAGVCLAGFEGRLLVAGETAGEAAIAELSPGNGPSSEFELRMRVPLSAIAPAIGTSSPIALSLSNGPNPLALLDLRLVPVAGQGPAIGSLDLADQTDTLLYDGARRRLFELQNPEEGFWSGTGQWHLRLQAVWTGQQGQSFSLETKPHGVTHLWADGSDRPFVAEDPRLRQGGSTTEAEFRLDTNHPQVAELPPEGKDFPLGVEMVHLLHFGQQVCLFRWKTPLPVRLRDPSPHVKAFQRLSAVGIDFGTSASVAALYQKGFRSLLRLGGSQEPSPENPTCLLIEDHEALWAAFSETAEAGERFPDIVRKVVASYPAREASVQFPTAVVDELKSLPERIMALDQTPQFRDREKQKDFLLDEARIRILIRCYAYLIGRAINRAGQNVYLNYWLTHPAKLNEATTELLEEELKAGILLSIPKAIPAELVHVAMRSSEPEAFAAEVCPDLAAHPVLEELVGSLGEMRFAVFDFGGGTLDIACGRYRPATEQEYEESGTSSVIETLQVGGDHQLGGENLTHELVWLTHQHPKHLPEMEREEVPMMRPPTVPANHLAEKPHLYKRSLAGRQNRARFQRQLQLERVKHARNQGPNLKNELQATRLDGGEVKLQTLKNHGSELHQSLADHLETRIRDGVRLLKSLLENTSWGEGADWIQQGVVLLLGGNSSRSEYVVKALSEELGLPNLQVWKPGCNTPFQQVVLYETPDVLDRGITIQGLTPKTAVAMGALKIANREVHLVRRTQGFSYFLGDLRGFPQRFKALIPMGALPGNPQEEGPHYVDFGRWDTRSPLRVSKEATERPLTSSDPRLLIVPTGFPPGEMGRLWVCPTSPEEIALRLDREGEESWYTTINLAKFVR